MLLEKENIKYMIVYIPLHYKSSMCDLLQGSVLCDIVNCELVQEFNTASRAYTKSSDENINAFEHIEILKLAIKKSSNLYCIQKSNLLLDKLLDKLSYFYLRNYKAYIIQKAWRQSINNPEYTICRKRLLNEFDELSQTS